MFRQGVSRFSDSNTPCALQKPPAVFFPPEHRVISQNTMHLKYAYRLVLERKTGT